jgi:hypothetical protein
MPITWKNVSDSSGPSQAAIGARLFEQSRQAMNDGFGGLEDALIAKQEEQKAAWQQGKVNNTEAAIANLRQYATADEYAAAQAAGQLEDGSQYGAQIDRNALNAFADTRLGTLQDAYAKTTEYGSLKFDEAAKPYLAEMAAIEARDGPEAAAAYAAKNAAFLRSDDIQDGTDRLYDYNNSKFDQNIATGQLDVSRGNLAVNWAGSKRADEASSQQTTLFKQGQQAYGRDEENRLQSERGTAIVDAAAQRLATLSNKMTDIPGSVLTARDAEVRKLLQADGLDAAEVGVKMQLFQDQVKGYRGLDATTGGQLAASQAPLVEANRLQQEIIKKKHQSEKENNILVATDYKNSLDEAQKLVKAENVNNDWGGSAPGWTGSEVTEVENKVRDWLDNGVTVIRDGKPSKVDVTSRMAAYIVKRANTEWSGQFMGLGTTAGDMDRYMLELASNPAHAQDVIDAQQLDARFIQDSSDQEALTVGRMKEMETEFRRKIYGGSRAERTR